MKKFKVYIERSIQRAVVVEATCLSDAKHQVNEYGLVETFNDFPEVEAETEDTLRVVRVVRIKE